MTSSLSPSLSTLQSLAGAIDLSTLLETEVRSLYAASQGDAAVFQRYLKRLTWGDPLPYITQQLTFRGHTFKIDRRAYITDPELTYLLDAVLQAIDTFTQQQGRSPRVAEFGIGCGSLSISLKLERPELDLVGIDIDRGAIALAQENLQQFGVDIPLIESDFFTSWPYAAPPDIIYGDPPWGESTDLYDEERSAAYYHAMPCMSAYPVGGKAAVHAGLLEHIAQRRWPSLLLLNCGVLPQPSLRELQTLTQTSTVLHPTHHLSILRCTVD